MLYIQYGCFLTSSEVIFFLLNFAAECYDIFTPSPCVHVCVCVLSPPGFGAWLPKFAEATQFSI